MEAKQIVEEAPKFLSEFYGMSEDAARERIQIGPKLVLEEWTNFSGSILNFYETVKNYPFDLAKFNSVWRLEFLSSVFDYMIFDGAEMRDYQTYEGKPTLLEVGGGGGELSLLLSDRFDVTHYDVPGVTFDYAKHRIERYNAPIKMCTELPDEKFDIVSMQDVYEHVENPMDLMHSLCDRMKDGAWLISSALFFSTSHPLHINENAAGRDVMGTMFANDLCLWATHTFESEGIPGQEPQTAIAAFKYRPSLNEILGEHSDLYLSLKTVAQALAVPDCLPHIDQLWKTSYIFTVM